MTHHRNFTITILISAVTHHCPSSLNDVLLASFNPQSSSLLFSFITRYVTLIIDNKPRRLSLSLRCRYKPHNHSQSSNQLKNAISTLASEGFVNSRGGWDQTVIGEKARLDCCCGRRETQGRWQGEPRRTRLCYSRLIVKLINNASISENNHVYSRDFQSMLNGLDEEGCIEESVHFSEKKRRLGVDHLRL
ncbi:hypothetical protein ACFE04_017880 [Oxalis oulophora]